MHWCLVTIRSFSFWCTTVISVKLHWVSIENSWICTIVINVMKSKKFMGHCFCHYWMFDAQIGLSLSFRKMRLNVWFMMFVSINLDILWWCIFWMSEYLLFHARPSCMNDWLLRYLYLVTLACSYFFAYWDLLNPNKLLSWIELNCMSMKLEWTANLHNRLDNAALWAMTLELIVVDKNVWNRDWNKM